MIRLSIEEVSDILGLRKIDEKTFNLDNIIIEIEQDGLKITKINSDEIVGAEATMFTKVPFRYTKNSINYSFRNEDNKLLIFREN